MRVISGKFKGHRLQSVPNMKTRPTSDKVKEALFHFIGPYFKGGKGLDLFAGSGGLGIEAISRGLTQVIFVDQQYKAIETIRSNIKALSIENQCEIYRNDALRALKAAAKRGKTFNYVFLDPPYRKVSFELLFNQLHELNLLENGAIIVCEHAQDEQLPQTIESYKMIKQDTYSSLICLTFYRYEK
ncbi:16S rRNA (guanine(966)-N(2))-methyltransferase RsmD [Bacillaceae bacterium W0354]